MAVLPFMQWYPADYAGDTTHLTDEEDLAYRRLLDAMWLRGGKLPDDARQLALIVRYSGPKWDACWPILRSFFKKNKHGSLVQKRLSTEYRKAKQLHEARVRGGRSAHSSAQAKKKLGTQLRARGYLEPEPEPEPVREEILPPIREPNGSLTPQSPPSRGGRAHARVRGRVAKKSPREVQTEAFFHAAAEYNRDR